jgi:hypothetical protein
VSCKKIGNIGGYPIKYNKTVMHNLNTERTLKFRKLIAVLLPSWLSGLVAVACGLLMTIYVIASFNLPGAGIKQELLNLTHTSNTSPVLTLPGQTPPGSNHNTLQNTWPLIAFWAIIGLIIYFVADLLFNLMRDVFALKNELTYVHSKRDVIIRYTAELLIFRAVIVLFWLAFLDLFFKRLIPYSILASRASASDVTSGAGLITALLSSAVIAFSLHVNTVFLRLALRRTRVLSTSDYLDVEKY